MYANPLEWPEVHCWRRVLREGDLFVDIGANIGVYSIWAIELGASVVAVEADPEAAGMLRENLRLNGYEQCARVVEAAVADRPGTMRFTTDLGVENHLVLDDAATGPLREVPVTTLDSLLGDRSAAGAKIDVEGAEALVLQGARRALAEGRIALIHLEWNSCSQALLGCDRSPIVGLLQEYGYRLYRPDMEGVLHPLVDTGPGPDVFATRAVMPGR